VIAAFVVLAEGAELLWHVPLRAFAAALAITLGDALIGYWVARPDVEDQMAISLAVALGNPALAIAVVEASYPDHKASELVAVYLIVRAIAILPFELWLKRLEKVRAVRRSIHEQASHA
jgi:predicted Na+-dependent transporter